MNKYKEVLKKLCDGCEYNPIIGECSFRCPAKEELKELVEKATPKKLVKRQFDNPPLKFEELEEGMVVWDNLEKNYIEICDSFNGQKIYYKFGINIPYIFMFQENRFYRRQVE